MSLFGLFWDLSQEQRIRDAQSTADRGAATAQSTRDAIMELQSAIDRLALVNQAQWELLREYTGLTDEELEAKVDEVDRRDGIRDGHAGAETAPCPRCRKPNQVRRTRCLYCGTTLAGAR
jgi:hypothetical protein